MASWIESKRKCLSRTTRFRIEREKLETAIEKRSALLDETISASVTTELGDTLRPAFTQPATLANDAEWCSATSSRAINGTEDSMQDLEPSTMRNHTELGVTRRVVSEWPFSSTCCTYEERSDDHEYNNAVDWEIPDTDTEEESEEADDCDHQKSASESLFEGSALTTTASDVLILEYSMKHGLTNEAITDLLKLLQLHLPMPNKCTNSIFSLKKLYGECDLSPVRNSIVQTVCLRSNCPVKFAQTLNVKLN